MPHLFETVDGPLLNSQTHNHISAGSVPSTLLPPHPHVGMFYIEGFTTSQLLMLASIVVIQRDYTTMRDKC